MGRTLTVDLGVMAMKGYCTLPRAPEVEGKTIYSSKLKTS